jgi:hypothetical protein
MSYFTPLLEAALSHKSGLFLNYMGTLLVANATGFNIGVKFGDYPTVVATHPSFLQWGIVLIGLGFILQFLDTASLRIKVFNIVLLIAPLVIKFFL